MTPGRPTHRRWVGAAFLALALAAPAGALTPHRGPPTRLVLDAGLLVRLRVLAAGLHNEIVLCLTGAVDGDTAVASGFVMPDPVRSDVDGASFGPCPSTALAVWHNHPLSEPPRPSGQVASSYRRPLGDPDASPRDLCALSATDIETAARHGHPFVVVAAGADAWCWWTHAQVRGLAMRQAMLGPSVRGQIEFRAGRGGTGEGPYQMP